MLDPRISFEESYECPEANTVTLYFIAPVDMLDGKYPDAKSMEISIEFPAGKPEARYAEVMFSPTKAVAAFGLNSVSVRRIDPTDDPQVYEV